MEKWTQETSVLKERCGKDNRALLKCKTCGHCFSETHGTPFFGLHTPMDEVCRTLAQIPKKGAFAVLPGHQVTIRARYVGDRSRRQALQRSDRLFLKEHPP